MSFTATLDITEFDDTIIAFESAATILPKSALLPNDVYYTDIIGGGFGTLMITTDGGHAANIGDPTGRNDDGFRGPIDLGFTIEFFGNSYSSFYLNNNGNISFNAGIAEYTPTGPQGAPQPIISPYFADLDSRGDLSGLVYYRQDIPNQLIITWDHVGYFSSRDDLFVSFQLVLRGPGYVIPPGEGRIGFFWKDMQWETGEASNGIDGFGGTPAAVGFGDGLDQGIVLEGSVSNGISTIVNHKKLWVDENLSPIRPRQLWPCGWTVLPKLPGAG
jgi:hypothetical protein